MAQSETQVITGDLRVCIVRVNTANMVSELLNCFPNDSPLPRLSAAWSQSASMVSDLPTYTTTATVKTPAMDAVHTTGSDAECTDALDQFLAIRPDYTVTIRSRCEERTLPTATPKSTPLEPHTVSSASGFWRAMIHYIIPELIWLMLCVPIGTHLENEHRKALKRPVDKDRTSQSRRASTSGPEIQDDDPFPGILPLLLHLVFLCLAWTGMLPSCVQNMSFWKQGLVSIVIAPFVAFGILGIHEAARQDQNAGSGEKLGRWELVPSLQEKQVGRPGSDNGKPAMRTLSEGLGDWVTELGDLDESDK